MFSVWGVWVARAVPPPTCAHGGSVGALDTPKLCPVGLELPRVRSEGTAEDVKFSRNESEMEAVRVQGNTNKLGKIV